MTPVFPRVVEKKPSNIQALMQDSSVGDPASACSVPIADRTIA